MSPPALTTKIPVLEVPKDFRQWELCRREQHRLMEAIAEKAEKVVKTIMFRVDVTGLFGVKTHSEQAYVTVRQAWIDLTIPAPSYRLFKRADAEKQILHVRTASDGRIITNAGPDGTWVTITSTEQAEILFREALLRPTHVMRSWKLVAA